jgi:acetyl-CoA acetyltransferase
MSQTVVATARVAGGAREDVADPREPWDRSAETEAAQHGHTPLACIVGTGISGLSPEVMELGPVEASRQALDRAGITTDDDLVEIDEPLADQVIALAIAHHEETR